MQERRKILPSPVVKGMIEAKVTQLAVKQARSATNKEREQFK
jgi:DNA recombination-dependent growth factor C